jgi:hypothetical protein
MNIQHTRLRLGREDGQGFVEFALVLPLLALLVFGMVQFGLLFRDYLAITDAARVAARAAAVKRTSDPCGAARAAVLATLSSDQQDVVSFPSGWCTAAGKSTGNPFTITIKETFVWPFPKILGIPNPTLTASATERME